MSTVYIGFGHRSGHGKDTCAKLLDTEIRIRCPRLRVKRISFADKLKQVTYDLYAWAGVKRPIEYENNRKLRGDIIPALGCTVVDLWVMVGEKLREIYPNTWLDYLLHTDQKADVVLIADVRHPNEALKIQDKKGRLYKVWNPRIPDREGKSIDHMLELYNSWDGKIINDEGIPELNTKIRTLADELIETYGWKK